MVSILDEIIEAATDENVPIGTLLRKCLVLEASFKNAKFKAWLDKELDGYDEGDDLQPCLRSADKALHPAHAGFDDPIV